MRRGWVWPRGTSHPLFGCSTETVLQGVPILVSLVRVERLDEDLDRIHMCLSRAKQFTSLGSMDIPIIRSECKCLYACVWAILHA